MQKIEYDLPIFNDGDIADLNEYSELVANALKVQIDKFGNPLTFKGTVETLAELELLSDIKNGDIYLVKSESKNYIYNGTGWVVYSDNEGASLNILVVETLPTENIQEKTIYLVPNTQAKENNIYDEYIYINNTWEIIGNTAVDLSNYYNKEEVDNKIDNIQALPVGGTTGQVLTKQSDTDGDASWEDSIAVNNTSSTSQTDTYSCDYINKLDVNLIQGEIENGGAVLWENPNKTVAFASQTIELSSDDYDELEFLIANSKTDINFVHTIRIKKGNSINFNLNNIYINGSSQEAGFSNRYAEYVDDKHYLIKDNFYYDGKANTFAQQNLVLIPIKVIGYKNTIPAVVVKEKTEMVEEIYSTEEQVIGKWIDGKLLYRKVIDVNVNNLSTSNDVSFDCTNIEQVIEIKGIMKRFESWEKLPKGTSNSDYLIDIYVYTNENKILIAAGNSVINGISKIYLIIEYTKTTDTGEV